MSTNNLHHNPIGRSSGHKEATEEHTTLTQMQNSGDNGNPQALLKNRILSNAQVSRAALYDHDDFLCIASSSQAFDLPPDDVRKILDGQLTFSRQGDPTMASGAAHPPDNLSVGKEGKASVKRGNGDWIVAELNGKPFIAARTATNVLLVEGNEDANVGSLETLVQSFQEGLQQLTL